MRDITYCLGQLDFIGYPKGVKEHGIQLTAIRCSLAQSISVVVPQG